MIQKEAEQRKHWAKPVVEALGVISGGKWQWKPEPGEWCMSKDGIVYLISRVSRGQETQLTFNVAAEFYRTTSEIYIPILPWEIIEEIVCSFGFETGGPWWHTRGKDEYEFGIFKPKGHWTGFGKKRYESVVNSLLELAKDLKKELRKK